MEMENLVNLILNSSVSIVVIVYFMFRDWKIMGTLGRTLQELVDSVKDVEQELKINRRGGDRDGSDSK